MLAISLYLQQGRAASSVSSPGGYASPSSGGLGGAIGGVASAAATAAGAAVVTGAVGVRDLSWHAASSASGITGGGGSFGGAGNSPRTSDFGVLSSGGISSSSASGGHTQGPPSSSGGGFAGGLGALLGRGREADAAFTAALETYQRHAAEDSLAKSARRTGDYGGGAASQSASVRLGARAALLYADVISATAETYPKKDPVTGTDDLQVMSSQR